MTDGHRSRGEAAAVGVLSLCVLALTTAAASRPCLAEAADAPAALPAYPPPAPATPDWGALQRVVYDDPRYPTAWVQDPRRVADRAADRADFAVVDAPTLKAWMSAQIAKGAAGAVCLLARGVVPDTVAETPDPGCTLRKFLDAGGRVVWIGDVPFFYRGHAGGGRDTWGAAAEKAILGVESAFLGAAVVAEAAAEGRAWGLQHPDSTSRPVAADSVTAVFSLDPQGRAASWFKNFAPRRPESGFVRYRSSPFTGTTKAPLAGDPSFTAVVAGMSMTARSEEALDALIDDLLRVAVHGVTAASAPDAPPPGTLAVSAVETPLLFVRRGDEVRQVLRVTVDNWWKKTPARARVQSGGTAFETDLEAVAPGRRVYEVDAPAVAAAAPAAIEVRAGPAVAGAGFTLTPRRRWTVFLDPSVHTDIGYTDYQENVLKLHNENLDKAVEACAVLPSFKWDLENAWQFENYEANRTPEQVERLAGLVREGRMGVAALYLNILTGACAAETLNRSTLGAANLRRRFGIRAPQALLTDVPSAVGTLPAVLAASGVRWFAEGVNQTRAPYYADPQTPPMPFWWEAPDGSRVLTWLSDTSYSAASQFGFTESLAAALARTLPHLERFEQRQYPWDAILLYGAMVDNQPVDPAYARVIDAWNARYAFPRIVLAAQGEYFEHMEKTYGDRIPVLRGDNGCYWEDGAASTAYETTLNRRSQEEIVTAEKLHAANAVLAAGGAEGRREAAAAYPQAALAAQWKNILFYVEHTWGAHNSMSQPDLEFVRRQWAYKAEFAREPARALGPLVGAGLEAIGRRVRTGESPVVMVFNPLSWDRADAVRVELPEGLRATSWTVTRARTGEALPTQRVDERTIAFIAAVETGGMGYETYPLKDVGGASGPDSQRSRPEAAPTVPAVARPDPNTLENRFYKVVVDPRTGGIASLIDKELGQELIDPESPYRANEHLYVAGGENSRLFDAGPHPEPKLKITRPQAAAVRTGADGPVYGSLLVEASNAFTPKIVTEVILYRDVKRVDLVNRLTKQENRGKEGVYFAFPFNLRKPDIRFEIPDGAVRPEADQFGGGCRDWYAVQHWISVGATSGSRSPGGPGTAGGDRGRETPPTPWRVTLSAPDSLLFCVNDIFRGKWMKKGELKIENGTLYAWVMNNYWMTNYKAGQGGDFEFRFSITSAAGGPDDAAAARFGWGVGTPLLGRVLPAGQTGTLPAEQAFLSLDRPSAALTAFKRAETGDGWIARVLDLNGAGGPVRLAFPGLAFREATLTNLVEEPVRPLPVTNGRVELPLGPRGLVTVKLKE